MIVKNESHIIKRCLNSVKDIIDCWCIVDTGSSDNTPEIIKQELSHIPGSLFQKPWFNFGFNRTESIFLSKNFEHDYLLLIDADNEILNFSFDKNLLHHDMYYGKHCGDFDYARPMLIKSNKEWEWKGLTHEYLDCATNYSSDIISTLKFKDNNDGSSKKQKFIRDVELLQQELKINPNNSRTVFYLAQTYKSLGNLFEAKKYYEQRINMKGWEEEIWYSKYQIANILAECKKWPDALDSYLEAYEMRKHRIEPLYRLCNYYRENKKYNIAKIYGDTALKIKNTSDLLFVEKWMYDFGILDEMSLIYYNLGEFEKSVEMCHLILQNDEVKDKERIFNNLKIIKECLP